MKTKKEVEVALENNVNYLDENKYEDDLQDIESKIQVLKWVLE